MPKGEKDARPNSRVSCRFVLNVFRGVIITLCGVLLPVWLILALDIFCVCLVSSFVFARLCGRRWRLRLGMPLHTMLAGRNDQWRWLLSSSSLHGGSGSGTLNQLLPGRRRQLIFLELSVRSLPQGLLPCDVPRTVPGRRPRAHEVQPAQHRPQPPGSPAGQLHLCAPPRRLRVEQNGIIQNYQVFCLQLRFLKLTQITNQARI